ncbi:MAG: phage head-tail adapter protein [Nitratireductor sp.]|uniref:phage head closure protein n=1 Tax=Nitratireductor sp. B36 TaxID=2762059 RepID=UPI000C994880|nr:phage head closure protein [Nitratireductor sp. B36]MAS13430.1 phage head-tail adapter protein [Nitratireductor sp.]MCC5778174.1 phage head closure protein [Nitratireductor sp. B36]
MRVQFIDPGAFRAELSLQKATLVSDDAGGHTEAWSETATIFGFIEPVRAAAPFGAGQRHERVTHRITLRFRTGVTGGMRIVRGTRRFSILTAHDPDETGRYLVCLCEEEQT